MANWVYEKYGECPLFVVCIATPDEGAPQDFVITGEDVGGGRKRSPNVTAQLAGESTVTYSADPGNPITINGFAHVNRQTGQKGQQPEGTAQSVAGLGLVYMCCVARTQVFEGLLPNGSANMRAIDPIRLDYDVIEADGQYVAGPDTYYVPVLGGATIGVDAAAEYDALHVASAGPINISLDPGAKVFAIWQRGG